MKSIGPIFIVVLLIGGVFGYKAWVQKSTVNSRQSTETEGRKDPQAAQPLSPEQAAGCEKSLAEIRKLYQEIPDDVRKAKSIEELAKITLTCRDLGESFLRTCRSSPDEPEVQFTVAHCLLMLNRRELEAYFKAFQQKGMPTSEILALKDRWSAQYFGRVVELSAASFARLPEGRPERAKCLDIQGDGYIQGGKPGKALERYNQLLKEFPNFRERANVYLAAGKCHEKLGSFAEGIALIRKAMAELPRDPKFPFFYESLWALHLAAGDLPGLQKLAEEEQGALKERLKAADVSQDEKESGERYIFYGGFRLGYTRFALGDFPGAAAAFQAHLAPFVDPEKKSALPQDYQVYLTRSKDNLEVLTNKIGKSMPATLDRVLWTGGRRPELTGGKTLAIIFRNQGEDRSGKFLQAIDAHWRKHRERYDLVVISYLRPGGEPDSLQEEQVFQDAESLGIGCPVGLDPDIKEKQLFGAFNAIVGTATLAIVDRSGNYMWFQQDPWERDAAFSTAILERFLTP